MPAVGFIGQDGREYDFDDALAACEAGDEAFPYPYPLLKGMRDSIQERGDYISATSILHCIRQDFLKRRTDFYVQPEKLYPAFRGTLFHALMETRAPGNAFVEHKMIRQWRGIEIGGTLDYMTVFVGLDTPQEVVDQLLAINPGLKLIRSKLPEGRWFKLEDWKTTEELPAWDNAYKSHMRQVNIYRWLTGFPPERFVLTINYFSMMGFKAITLKDGTQRGRGTAKPVNQLMTDAEIDTLFEDRLVKLAASFKANTPMPYVMVPDEDKWACANYCEVAQLCESLRRKEQEAVWRYENGLPPEGTPGDPAPLWGELLDGFVFRLDQAFKSTRNLPADASVVGGDTVVLPAGASFGEPAPAPKPASTKRPRSRKGASS